MPRIRLPDGLEITGMGRAEARFLWEEIYVHQVYLQHGLSLSAGDCVVDVGANIGLFSLWASMQVERLRLYALEPIPALYGALTTNLAHLSGAELHGCALGSHKGSARFRYYPRATGWSTCRPQRHERLRESLRAWIGGRDDQPVLSRLARFPALFSLMTRPLFAFEEYMCPMTTLSEMMRDRSIDRIDLLKIDVEDSEEEVLAGIQPDDWRRIRQISMETEERSVERIVALLHSQSYRVNSETTAMLSGTPLRHVYARRD